MNEQILSDKVYTAKKAYMFSFCIDDLSSRNFTCILVCAAILQCSQNDGNKVYKPD